MIHKVKRMVAVTLALMLTLSLTACGQIPLGNIVSTPDGETVQAVSGTVTIKRGGETLTAEAGTTLNDGDIILTAANSTAWLQLGADRSIQMGENTELIMINRDAGYAWRFESGEVTVRIDRPMSGSERFALSVKNVNILVRGTSYTVTMLEELEQQLAQLERFKASIESIIATLESVKTPAATELLIRYKTLHIQVQGAINLVHGYIAILSIEVHDGVVVVEDEDGNEIEELSDGQDMVIGIDDTDSYDEESVIIIDDPGDIINIINPPSTTEPPPPHHTDNGDYNPPSHALGVDTMICKGNEGFAGIAILLNEGWSQDFDLDASDITDFTIYMNGVPQTVSGFIVVDWSDIFDNPDFVNNFPTCVAAYHIWFKDQYTEYPAEYRVSLKVKGVQLTQDDFDPFVIDANGNLPW